MADKESSEQEDEHEENGRPSVGRSDHDVNEGREQQTANLDRRPVQCIDDWAERDMFLPGRTGLHSPLEHDLPLLGLCECTDLPQNPCTHLPQEAATGHNNLLLLGLYECTDLPQDQCTTLPQEAATSCDNLPLLGLCEYTDLPQGQCTNLPQEAATSHNLLLLGLSGCTDLPQEAASSQVCASECDDCGEGLVSKLEEKKMGFDEGLQLQKSEELSYKKLRHFQDPMESVDSDTDSGPVFDSSLSELNLYIRNPFIDQSYHQSVQVYMLHASTSGPGNSQPEDPSFPEGCHLELKRLATFYDFPPSCPVFAVKLAGDGFAYRPQLQAVDCNFCKLRIHLSELNTPGFNLEQTHLNRSPQCPFKQRQDCGNVPFPNVEQFRGMLDETPESWTLGQGPDDVDSRQTTVVGIAGTGQTGTNTTISHKHDNLTTGTTTISITRSKQSRPSATPMLTGRSSNLSPVTSVTSGTATPAVGYYSATNTASFDSSAGKATRPNTETLDPQNIPGAAAQSTDGMNIAAQNTGGMNIAAQNTGGTNVAVQNTGGTNVAAQNTGGTNVAAQNTGGTNVAAQNTGGTNVAAQNTGGTNVAAQNTGGTNVAASRSTPGFQRETGNEEYIGSTIKKPKRKDMADLQKRLDSFTGKWKYSHVQTPERLAEAGLYFAGYEDCARCYFCGGGMKSWKPQDEPLIEHARFLPMCGFLHLSKGYMFVNIVQRKNRAGEHITVQDVEDEVQHRMAREGDREKGAVGSSQSESSVVSGNVKTATPGAAGSLDIKAQEEQNEELKSKMTCKICMEDDRLVALLPCGHVVVCQTCASHLSTCPFCRADIRNCLRARFT